MQINCDGVVHNPLGGASYVFEKEIIPYILGTLHKNKLKISVGAQPNSSPHFGTLETIALAFALARKIEEYDSKKKVTILYEVIETAPSETVVIDGVKYQRSLDFTGKIDTYFTEYLEILNHYKELTGIDYEIRYQYEFNEQPETLEVFKTVLKNREYVAKKLDQKYGNLRVRMSCPICGLTDKNSANNKYTEDTITFYCPEHGEYSINVNEGISKLEYNSPLRNLIRGMSYTATNQSENYDFEILRITGSDYAGFYQEELRYKVAAYLGCDVSKMSMIFYAPLVLDWSGAKLSKSLYVKKGAYKDIPKRFINYRFLKENLGFKGLDILYDIVINWINNPYMLFRHYSIYYFIKEFENMNDELTNGIYVSINPEPTSKIVKGTKNHEFRNYIPKKSFKFLYVYVTAPQSELKYVIEIGEIVKYPEKLDSDGDGNHDFNIGKKSKYAYPIIKVYELVYPISLEELKNKFGFVPPQAFSYAETFAKLTEYVSKAEKTIIMSK